MGSNAEYGVCNGAKVLTAAKTLTADDKGMSYFLDTATGYSVKLPQISTVPVATKIFTFIVKTAPSGGTYEITENTTYDTNKVITNGINELDNAGSDDGLYNAGHTTITFADGVAVAGDWFTLGCDGTYWYCTGQTNADGGITLA